MLKSVKEFIRSGGHTWPGGYPCALLMADGGCIDAQSARENYRQVVRAHRDNWPNREWQPVQVFVHWEGAPLICAHSNREIPSAYGETEQ